MQPAHLSEPVSTRLANSVWAFSQGYWRLVVVAMLATLHVAAFRGVADPWARALLLVHLGLRLLWQPLLRAEQRISPMQGFILSLVAFVVMLALDWWLLAFWVVVLAGLVGGKVYQHHARWQRLSYLVVLAYLLAPLPGGILPQVPPRPGNPPRDPQRRRISATACVRAHSAASGGAGAGRHGAGDRFLLQHVPD